MERVIELARAYPAPAFAVAFVFLALIGWSIEAKLRIGK
jgi:hypothetical protein